MSIRWSFDPRAIAQHDAVRWRPWDYSAEEIEAARVYFQRLADEGKIDNVRWVTPNGKTHKYGMPVAFRCVPKETP